jgi:hypothetical protein
MINLYRFYNSRNQGYVREQYLLYHVSLRRHYPNRFNGFNLSLPGKREAPQRRSTKLDNILTLPFTFGECSFFWYH